MLWRNITLEMSLKPFTDTSEARARQVCRHLFMQWRQLLVHAETVSVLLWCSDGSEVLEYRGRLDEPFEWARYIGSANPALTVPNDPERKSLWAHPYLYMEDPPVFTFGWLKRLVEIIKEEGRLATGRPIRVGETFDPGPEFAASSFKYERHPEICAGETMGKSTFVCCYTSLNSDADAYAGFPDGIPEGTPFGTFFGRQCREFLGDLGFDYVWFSNGFGFGLETWALRGALFDGKRFSADRTDEVREKNLDFWELFRAECPGYPIETRGTNLSTGMDLSSDAVPLREIYEGGFDLEPPPNSPWAAINHDFGLELIGWMSHVAEVPGETYPFRFYTHDPWWLNSPWLDRYEREPHDIYMPLAVSRIDPKGEVRTPTAVLFLTADDSYGRMPDQVPNEVIPHVLAGKKDEPDAPGPLVWVYPFDEYHDWTFGDPPRLEEVFFGDWFMRDAVGRGLPLNTVVSTRSIGPALEARPDLFAESILVSPVPEADSHWESLLLDHVEKGGKVLLYGPLAGAGERTLSALHLSLAEPLDGEFEIESQLRADSTRCGEYAPKLQHYGTFSAGGVRAAADDAAHVLVPVVQDDARRAAAATAAPGDGTLTWVRGTVACDPEETGGHLLVPLPPEVCFPAPVLMRWALQTFGIEFGVEKENARQPDPMFCIARHRNAFFFSGHSPDPTVSLSLRMPQGAPLLQGLNTVLRGGRARYTLPTAWHRECRVFVEQEADAVISCRDMPSTEIGVERRVEIMGLEDATVRFYPETGAEEGVRFLHDPHWPFINGDFREPQRRSDALGSYMELTGISGILMITW